MRPVLGEKHLGTAPGVGEQCVFHQPTARDIDYWGTCNSQRPASQPRSCIPRGESPARGRRWALDTAEAPLASAGAAGPMSGRPWRGRNIRNKLTWRRGPRAVGPPPCLPPSWASLCPQSSCRARPMAPGPTTTPSRSCGPGSSRRSFRSRKRLLSRSCRTGLS